MLQAVGASVRTRLGPGPRAKAHIDGGAWATRSANASSAGKAWPLAPCLFAHSVPVHPWATRSANVLSWHGLANRSTSICSMTNQCTRCSVMYQSHAASSSLAWTLLSRLLALVYRFTKQDAASVYRYTSTLRLSIQGTSVRPCLPGELPRLSTPPRAAQHPPTPTPPQMVPSPAVGHGRCCSQRHPTHLQPSFMSRGGKRHPLTRRVAHSLSVYPYILSASCSLATNGVHDSQALTSGELLPDLASLLEALGGPTPHPMVRWCRLTVSKLSAVRTVQPVSRLGANAPV